MYSFNYRASSFVFQATMAIASFGVSLGLGGSVLAQDFSVNSSSIRMKKYSTEMMEEIKKRKNPKIVRLEKASGDAELAEVGKWGWVESLEIRSDNIGDISPVANLKSLKKVRLSMKKSRNSPVDLSPLAQLTNLEEFDSYATKINKSESLSALTNLKVAKLYMADTDSLDFLAGTPNLEVLDLYGFGHTFENYEPVSKLKNLKKLNIYMNKQAVDEKLAVLKSLTSLQEMRLSKCKSVTTLSFVENCKSMTRIDASWCSALVDFSALKAMDQLEHVEFSKATLENIEFLAGKKKLKHVSLDGTGIKHVNELKGLPNLETVYLESSAVTDISGLAEVPALRFLSINKTKISDLSPLTNSEKLFVLTARETQVSDLSPLKGKQLLKNLFLNKTPVTDISPLADLPQLYYLDLTETAVSDISIVASLANLSTLNLGGTKVTDFSPIHSGLPKLSSVVLPKSTSEETLSELKAKRPKTRFQVAN